MAGLHLAAADGEAAALLAVLGADGGTRADAEALDARVHQSAAPGRAVGVAGAASRDELRARAVSDVGRAGRILHEGGGLDGAAAAAAAAAAVVVLVFVITPLLLRRLAVLATNLITASLGVCAGAAAGTAAETAGLKAAALLAGLGLGAKAGADADGLAALGQRGTASGRTVSSPLALAADELGAGAVADVLLAGRIRKALPG